MTKLSRFSLLLLVSAPAALFAQEKIDMNMMEKIKNEGYNNSKIMEIAFNLTDVSGPRLTNSPGYNRAANYAKNQLAQWGLNNAQLDPWGDFGKGWELKKSYVAMTAPYYKPLIALPKAWTKGTGGAKTADVLLISAKDSAGLDAYRGKLGGKLLIIDRNDVYKQSFTADANRYTDSQLTNMANATMQPRGPVDTAALRRRREQFARQGGGQASMLNTLKALATQEGALGMFSVSPRGHDGTIFVQGGGAYKATDPENPLDIMLALEDYMTMVRLLKSNIPVKVEADVKTEFYTKDVKGYNVIAEIKGTDKNLKEEVVMLGGHLDSWHGSTGATDNAAGCAVMMEAVRILKTLGVQPRRTIRIALWSGEEEGLLGSRAYVKKTFGDPATMKLLPAHEKFSSYFNIDNGTGRVRGIYLQGNEAARDVFTQWFQPFKDSGSATVTISNTGGTDHQSFDALGLPGFQFIQDEIEYNTRTHHTNMDSYDHLIEADLKHTAVILAAFVYNAAQRDEKLPRKALPTAAASGR